VRADVLFAELASDFGGELVVGGGPFRELPTVMQSTVLYQQPRGSKPGPTSLLSTIANMDTGPSSPALTDHLVDSSVFDMRRFKSNDSGYHSDPSRSYIAKAQDTGVKESIVIFPCHLCPKMFIQVDILRSHLHEHTDDWPFICKTCWNTFACSHDHRRHERLHRGLLEFICRGELRSQPDVYWGCGRHFSHVDGLIHHLRFGTGKNCIQPLFSEEASQSPAKHPVKNPSVGPGTEIQLDAEELPWSRLPTALLLQYPALQITHRSSIRLGQETGRDHVSGLSSYEKDSPYLSNPNLPLRIEMLPELGGAESWLQRHCPDSPDEPCQTKTKNSATEVESAWKQHGTPKTITDSSAGLHVTRDSVPPSNDLLRVDSTSVEMFDAPAYAKAPDNLSDFKNAHSKLRTEKDQSTNIEDITKLTRNPKTYVKQITEKTTEFSCKLC